MKLKKLRTLLCPCFIILSSLQIFAQPHLTTAEWQEDLNYLRDIIITERPNLFHTTTQMEWKRAANELDANIPNMQRHEIIVGLARLISMFRIGHTVLPVHPWRRNPDPNVGFHRFPLLVYVFPEGVFVRSAKEKYRDAVGGKVVRIGKLKIDQALEAVRPVIPWENEQYFKSALPYYLSCPEILHASGVIEDINKAQLVFEKNGREHIIWLEAEEAGSYPGRFGIVNLGTGWVDARQDAESPTPLWLQNLDRNYFYEYLPDAKTVYVRHSSVRDQSDETIAEFFGKVFKFVDENDVEKFVLDLRLNGGGNNYRNRSVIVGLIQAKKINQPGRLFTILGRRTFSAAQNLVNEIEKYTETIFVGEPTAENVNFYGDTVQKTLPNSGLQVRLSHLWWQNLDPRDTREWTAPQIAVDMTFEDYRNNRDPVLETILNYEPQLALYEQLKALYAAGKFEQASKVATESRDNPQNRYINVEDHINRVGYELMNENNLDAALRAFELNIELFPNSANCFDSLAECYWKQGQLNAAISNYKKAIEMDPDGSVGQNATRMLEQVQAQMEAARK